MRHTGSLENLDLRKYYPFFITKNLMLEGASFLLMRYLAVTKFVGTIELSTMYINGEMCRNIYVSFGIYKKFGELQLFPCRNASGRNRGKLMGKPSTSVRFTGTSSKSAV